MHSPSNHRTSSWGLCNCAGTDLTTLQNKKSETEDTTHVVCHVDCKWGSKLHCTQFEWLKRRFFIVDRWEISTEKSNVRGHQGSQWIDGTTFNLHWFDGTTTCISIDGTCFALVAQLLKPDIVWGRTHLTSTIEKIPYWNWSKFEEKNLSSFAFYCLETKHLKPHKNLRNKT